MYKSILSIYPIFTKLHRKVDPHLKRCHQILEFWKWPPLPWKPWTYVKIFDLTYIGSCQRDFHANKKFPKRPPYQNSGHVSFVNLIPIWTPFKTKNGYQFSLKSANIEIFRSLLNFTGRWIPISRGAIRSWNFQNGRRCHGNREHMSKS
jgi:hypothetical protein